MSDVERDKVQNEVRKFERNIVAQVITRSEFERSKDTQFSDGGTIGKFVEYGTTDGRLRWDEEGHLVPDYAGITQNLKLQPKTVQTLREKSLTTGLMPDIILRRTIEKWLEND